MLILSMSEQAILFLTTIVLGSIIGFCYDFIRIFRFKIYHPNFLINIEDFIYWILATGFVFFIMLNRNYGEIRFFTILGVFLGMILYFCTISLLFLKVAEAVIEFIRKIIVILYKIISAPFILIFKILIIPYKVIKKIIVKLYKKEKKVLKKFQMYVRIKRQKTLNRIKIILKKM